MTQITPIKRGFTLVSLCLILSACGEANLGLFDNPYRTNGVTSTIDRPAPDERGVITYETYQVMVARPGDSVASMAARVGLAPEALATHNGLDISYRPRPGELLALPGNVGGETVTSPTGWSTAGALEAIETASLSGVSNQGRPTEPLRHRVGPGDTAYSVARRYGVSVTALASWNGLGSDLALRQGQELIIPVPDASRAATTTSVDTSSVETTTVASGPTATRPTYRPTRLNILPTSAPAPQPQPEAEPTPEPEPQPTANTSAPFIKPVSGSVLRPYNPAAGVSKNDGIDYAAPAGTPVKAAADGVVALISQAAGGLGTIILVRHETYITIYGHVTDVKVKKGDRVSQGEVIAGVASGNPDYLHFEIRKGTESIDPGPLLR